MVVQTLGGEGAGQGNQAEMLVVVLSMSCLSNLQRQAWRRRTIFFSDISVLCQGTQAVPHFAFLERDPWKNAANAASAHVSRALPAGCAH